MAKLSSKPFRHEGPSGEVLAFSADVSVDSEGVFSIVIPDDLAETARGLPWDGHAQYHHGKVAVTRPRVQWRVSSKSLDSATAFVRSAMKKHLDAVVIVERVICYSHNVAVTYWEDPDGTIHPNGYAGTRREDGGRWQGNLNAQTTTTHFSVGLWARVFDRHTITRGEFTKVIFERPADIDHLDASSPVGRLNSFTGLHYKPGELTPWMPYTDEAAIFFADMLTRMCALARGMNEFMGSPDRIQVAIKSGGANLLGMSPDRAGAALA